MYHGTQDIIFYTDSKIKQKLSKYRLLLLKKKFTRNARAKAPAYRLCVKQLLEIRLNLYAE